MSAPRFDVVGQSQKTVSSATWRIRHQLLASAQPPPSAWSKVPGVEGHFKLEIFQPGQRPTFRLTWSGPLKPRPRPSNPTEADALRHTLIMSLALLTRGTEGTRNVQKIPVTSQSSVLDFCIGPSLQLFDLTVRTTDLQAVAAYDIASARSWDLTVSIERSVDTNVSPPTPKEQASLARRAAPLHLTSHPHDVRLVFPRVGKDGAELWANGGHLSSTSSYFKDLLTSEFAESIPVRSKRRRDDGAQPARAAKGAPKDFDDSDDEADTLLVANAAPILRAAAGEQVEHAYREVTITQAAYSTYRAVLLYILTGHIEFAPLSSSYIGPPVFGAKYQHRSELHVAQYGADPAAPLAVSPKSVYRLAHLLDLPALQRRALAAIEAGLTTHGAAVEMFSDASISYDEVRRLVLAYVARNWNEVRQTPAWKDVMDRIKRDEIPGGGGIVVEVLQAVSDK